jgi:protein-S-isoprenylcysteine O-methyltransferase Ste14
MAKVSDMDTPVIAGYMEELRFAKRQQWAVAGYAIALIAGAFQLMKPPLTTCEKSWVTLAIVGVAAGGIWLVLWDLQRHLASIRTTLDANDGKPSAAWSAYCHWIGACHRRECRRGHLFVVAVTL